MLFIIGLILLIVLFEILLIVINDKLDCIMKDLGTPRDSFYNRFKGRKRGGD